MEAYLKKVYPFYQSLLSKIEKISIFSLPNNPAPHDNTHYQVSKEGIVILTSNVIKLSHELAHIIECKNDAKLLQNDYGIKKYYPETSKGKLCAIARESRTRGIQTRLVELAVGSCKLLSFSRPFPALSLDTGSGGLVEYSSSYLGDWSRHIVATSYRSFTKDKIVHLWEHKSLTINNYLSEK